MSEQSRLCASRRRFLAMAAGTAVTAGFTRAAVSQDVKASRPQNSPVCVFTKPFNSLSFDELAEHIAEMGVDGIEAPIRPGGHIEPEQVPDRLPELVEALKSRGLEITVMTSDINDPDNAVNEQVLRTAAALGVRRYRMKYFKYDLRQSIAGQLRNWNAQVRDLAAMNAELGITAVYQNHAGRNYCGAGLWDLEKLLDGVSSTLVGVAFDIRHATVEGTTSWPVAFQMLRPRIDTVYVKDFQWVDGRPRNVPLGEGHVSSDFFLLLKQTEFSGPVSLHEEYLDHRRPELVPQHLAAISRDLATLKTLRKID